jgi:hypothetical protein
MASSSYRIELTSLVFAAMLRNRSCACAIGHVPLENASCLTASPSHADKSQGRATVLGTTMACAKFTLDLSGDFGKCKCGYAKAVRFAAQPARFA